MAVRPTRATISTTPTNREIQRTVWSASFLESVPDAARLTDSVPATGGVAWDDVVKIAGASVLDGKASIAGRKVPRIHIRMVPAAAADVNRRASLWFWKVTATMMLPQSARTAKVPGSI